jgi:hypothetical protein
VVSKIARISNSGSLKGLAGDNGVHEVPTKTKLSKRGIGG